MAGIKTLHYIDVDNVTSQRPSGDGWSVTLASGHEWKQIHFSQVQAATEREGGCYRHSVEATVPGKGSVSARDLLTLEQGRYLVRATDNNGVQWLIGDTESPLRLTVTDTHGGTPQEETAYRLTFSGISLWPQMRII